MFKARLDKKIIKMFVLLAVMVSTSLTASGVAFALAPQDHVVMVSAQVQQAPPTIKLTWLAPPTAVTGYTIYRKEKVATSWGTAVTTLSSTTLEYTDTNLMIGTPYEYKISSNYWNGYICSGIMLLLS